MHVLGFAICAFLELDDSDKGKSFNFAFQFFDPNGQVILGANDGTLVVPANSLGNETRLAHKLPGLAFTAPGKYMLILTVGQETREFPLTIEEVPNVQ